MGKEKSVSDRLGRFCRFPTRKELYLTLALAIPLLCLAPWVGPLYFYYTFQRPLEKRPPNVPLQMKPEPVDPVFPTDWKYMSAGGVSLPVPSGELLRFEENRDGACAYLKEGVVTYKLLPRGFFGKVYLEERKALGLWVGLKPPEVDLVERIASTAPRDFRFSWSGARRLVYAAFILSKMRIWPDKPAVRFELCRKKSHRIGTFPLQVSILAEYRDGSATILVASAAASVVVTVSSGVPSDWRTSPAAWFLGEP